MGCPGRWSSASRHVEAEAEGREHSMAAGAHARVVGRPEGFLSLQRALVLQNTMARAAACHLRQLLDARELLRCGVAQEAHVREAGGAHRRARLPRGGPQPWRQSHGRPG